MGKILITIAFLGLLALAAAQEAKPAQAPPKPAAAPYYTIPMEAARKENPSPPHRSRWHPARNSTAMTA